MAGFEIGDLSAGSESGLVGQHDRLDSVAEPEFGQYASDVGFHGGFGKVELGADLGIGQAAGDGSKHVEFAWGEHL